MANPEWIGVVNSTATRFLQGAIRETLRNRIVLAMLEKKGRIKYGQTGRDCNWVVQFDQQPMQSYGDMGQITFERHDLLRQCVLDWRGYIATDAFSEKERLMNRGEVAIVNRYKETLPNLVDSMRARFGAELYVDGNASGNSNRIHGIASFTGASTVAAGDLVAVPSDTYAGRSTTLASEGGSWSTSLTTKPNSTIATDWPSGNGDATYDYFSPKLVNSSSTSWGTGSTSFVDNCELVLRKTRLWLTSTGGEEGTPDMCISNIEDYNSFLTRQSPKQRIDVPYQPGVDLGFAGSVNFEGMGISMDFDVPVGTSYVMNFDKMELACMYDQLFYPRGPEFYMKELTYLMEVGYFGNMRFRPKHFGEIKARA